MPHKRFMLNFALVLLRFARSRWLGGVVGWGLAHMSFLLPVDRLRETPTVLAFYHPRPSYPVHILIVPKRVVPNFLALLPTDADVLRDLVQVAQELIRDLQLERRGYRLIINGGAFQDVPQLHVHVISEAEA